MKIPIPRRRLAEGPDPDRRVVLGVRPPDLTIVESAAEAGAITARVDVREPMDPRSTCTSRIRSTGWIIRVDGHHPAREGEVVRLAMDPHALYLFDQTTELSLLS